MGSLQETVSYRSSNHLYSHYLLDPLYNNGKARYLLDQAKIRIPLKYLIVNFKVGRSRRVRSNSDKAKHCVALTFTLMNGIGFFSSSL